MPTSTFIAVLKQRGAELLSELDAINRVLTIYDEQPITAAAPPAAPAPAVKRRRRSTDKPADFPAPARPRVSGEDIKAMREMFDNNIETAEVVRRFGGRYTTQQIYTQRWAYNQGKKEAS